MIWKWVMFGTFPKGRHTRSKVFLYLTGVGIDVADVERPGRGERVSSGLRRRYDVQKITGGFIADIHTGNFDATG